MNYYLEILKENLQNKNYKGFLERLETPLRHFSEEICQNKDLNISKINNIYSNLLGIGQGSTPQSDDVFLGVITAITIINPEVKEKLLHLATIRYETFTTKKSSILIRKFLRGNFPREVQRLIDFILINNQTIELNNEIQEVKAIGASSGIYYLIGLLWYFEYCENLR